MRVTIASETYFPQINGVSRTLGRLVDFLRARGDRVQLLIPRYPEEAGSPGSGEDDLLVRSVALPFYREIKLGLTTRRAVIRALEEFGSEVVHAATEGPLGISAMRAAGKLGLPRVSSFHTNFPEYLRYYRLGALTPLAWRYLRWFHNAGRFTFCPSRSIWEQLGERGFTNVKVWSRGVECDRFAPGKRSEQFRRSLGVPPDDVLVTYVGRLANEKNLAVLLDAFKALSRELRCRLMFVGDGPMRRRLEERADDRIVFAGYKRGEDLAVAYASADLFVFPSLTDTFGNVILEGMASGLPAVGFDAPGPRDIIRDGITGRVLASVSVQALHDALAHIVTTPETRVRWSAAARSYALSQSWDAVNSVVTDAYAEAVRAHNVTAFPVGAGSYS